jgi:hypothetical protein
MFPNFIALIPCRLSRKTRLKTIASNRTIVSAPRYFGIGNVRLVKGDPAAARRERR